MTWRDDVVETGDTPVRAGWEVLDGLRSIGFTGAVEFQLMPVATAYLDRGRIYYAARSDDHDVADRLVAAGVIRPQDLAAGVMVVGDRSSTESGSTIDHLGRLFERVPTLDRHRVMLALELMTEETAAWVARQSVPAAQTRPYAFHHSGVHQWYLARPVVAVHAAPASFAPPTPRPGADRRHTPADLAGVRIEWSAPSPGDRPTWTPGPVAAATPPWGVPRVPFDGPVDDRADDAATFEIVWPSGEVGSPVAAFRPPSAAERPAGDGLDRFDTSLDGADDVDGIDGTGVDHGPSADEFATSNSTIAVRRAMATVESAALHGWAVTPAGGVTTPGTGDASGRSTQPGYRMAGGPLDRPLGAASPPAVGRASMDLSATHPGAGRSRSTRSLDGRSLDGRSLDGHSPEVRSPDGHSPEVRSPEVRSPDVRSSAPRGARSAPSSHHALPREYAERTTPLRRLVAALRGR